MLTKRQQWRRMRGVRYNNNIGIRKSASDIMGGSGSGSGSNNESNICYGSVSSTAMAHSSSGSSRDNTSNPGAIPCRTPPLPSAQAAAATAASSPVFDSDGAAQPPSPPSSPPPRPLSPTQEQATPPSTPETTPETMPEPRSPTLGCDTGEPPTASTARGEEQPQQPQRHPHGQNHHHHQQSGNPFAANAGAACHHRHHPLEAWRTSAMNLLRLLFLFDAGGGAEDGRARQHHHNGGGGGWGGWGVDVGGRNRAATEDCRAAVGSAAARSRSPSEPACRPPSPPKARVRFSHQIRVILVASRNEMSAVKADVWWTEKDYCDFRRAYLITAREERESTRERELDLRRTAAEGRLERGHGDARSHQTPLLPAPAPLSSITATSVADEAGDTDSTVAAIAPPETGDAGGVVDGDDIADNYENSRLLRTVSPRAPPPSPESEPRIRLVAAAAKEDSATSGGSGGKGWDDARAAAPAVAGAVDSHERRAAVVSLDRLRPKERHPFATIAATSTASPSCGGASGPPGLLGARTDLRIDPRTGGRIPLPFLGDAPIRRVASF